MAPRLSDTVPGLTPQQIEAVKLWASSKSEISSVYIFGSRAKGTHHIDSDLDVAYRSDLEWYELNRSLWKGELENLLNLNVDLQLAEDDDLVVWPAVLDHGIHIYTVNT
ncbi:nucleotidyltransferase domain-containing protein [Asticcacaulis sp. ZE23SCel15]|uniref:nucleotidyltransferase family protein n=1 Tax=Asticcacaulis sp. ZE23SCel15 TaxID=3059027 RepID=UPI00265F61E9|nr:nucleotidyltransferase domain-containing protein [Asticcacaulis sp. ZE23SCel15]WKL56897.1 nucleotidyltransferase domain-containing protein [Asticcacaulis sp. ZE23SCel15]